jgi:putative transposase
LQRDERSFQQDLWRQDVTQFTPMARLPRLAIASRPHLVLQRTLPSQPAFIDDEDRRAFLAALRSIAAAERVAVHAYALLDHEVRLLVTPAEAPSLGRLMQAVGRAYVGGFNRRHGRRGTNRRHGRRGTLWDGRFRATVLDEETLLFDTMRYVETPPDPGATPPAEHTWSSAPHHLGLQASSLITEHPRFWRLGNTPFEREAAWRALLEQPLAASRLRDIEAAVLKGWALGPPAFVQALAAQTERRLQPRSRGRPRKALA